ncbi:hypothetical protein ABW19_dt0202198 [Dactylella cylindrospora]|nr:hypothetical protein ABW19_dt0202198 [Dactylella cylindrospora]
MGDRDEVIHEVRKDGIHIGDSEKHDGGLLQTVYARKDVGRSSGDSLLPTTENADAVVEMNGIRIGYRKRNILKDFSWTIRRGERWGLFGPNVAAIFSYFGISPLEQETTFGDCGLSTQKLALFMRALVKKPDIVILDEAFSGMDEELRDRCMGYLEENLEDRQALVVVSHLEEEIPKVVDRWVKLQEAGGDEQAIFGKRE